MVKEGAFRTDNYRQDLLSNVLNSVSLSFAIVEVTTVVKLQLQLTFF
jgi:hypothetical protein